MIEYNRIVAEKGYTPDDPKRDLARIREAVKKAGTSSNRNRKRPISPVRRESKNRRSAKSANLTARSSTWKEADDNREESYGDQSWGQGWEQHDWESHADQSWNQQRFDCLMNKHGIDEVGMNSLHALMCLGWRGERASDKLMEKLSYNSNKIADKSHWLHAAIKKARADIYDVELWESYGWVDNRRWGV